MKKSVVSRSRWIFARGPQNKLRLRSPQKKFPRDQVSDLLGKLPKVAFVDRGYKGHKEILGVDILVPGSGKGKNSL